MSSEVDKRNPTRDMQTDRERAGASSRPLVVGRCSKRGTRSVVGLQKAVGLGGER